MVAIHAPMISTPFLQNKTIVIAESQSLARKPVEMQLRQLGATVYHCNTRKELLDFCDRLNPHLLLLGTLPKTNSLDLFRQYRDGWHGMPVILLAHQPVVNDYFRDWAIKQGVDNVVSSYPQNFAQIRIAVKETLFPLLEIKKSTGKVIPIKSNAKSRQPEIIETTGVSRYHTAIALNQISEFGKKYFGNLAIGNYWRKTRADLEQAYPLLRQWSVDHWGSFEAIELEPFAQEKILPPEELESLKIWVLAFTKECQRIVVNFPQLLQQSSTGSVDFQFLL